MLDSSRKGRTLIRPRGSRRLAFVCSSQDDLRCDFSAALRHPIRSSLSAFCPPVKRASRARQSARVRGLSESGGARGVSLEHLLCRLSSSCR